MVEIAARDFAGSFGQRLNRHGHLLGEEKRNPCVAKIRSKVIRPRPATMVLLYWAKIFVKLAVNFRLRFDLCVPLQKIARKHSRGYRVPLPQGMLAPM